MPWHIGWMQSFWSDRISLSSGGGVCMWMLQCASNQLRIVCEWQFIYIQERDFHWIEKKCQVCNFKQCIVLTFCVDIDLCAFFFFLVPFNNVICNRIYSFQFDAHKSYAHSQFSQQLTRTHTYTYTYRWSIVITRCLSLIAVVDDRRLSIL